MKKTVRVAITAGEPSGIGTEVAWKALARLPADSLEILLVGPGEVWRRGFEAAGKPRSGKVTLVEVKADDLHWEWGKLNPATAAAALASVEKAARMALAGEADAIVTAPLTKEGLALAGSGAPGHTELLGELCAGVKPHMFFHAPDMNVILVTTHLPLREVPDAVTPEAVLETIRAAHTGLLADFGIANPRIAVAGLNPHAGENGRLGGEDSRIIAPAVREAVRQGIDAVGPLPADALFARYHEDGYGAAVAMYHDQGLGPFKLKHMTDGVNVTLGLPIVRTSPDHGTAPAIAGKGVANPGSMEAAIVTAASIARRRAGACVR